MKSTNTLRDTDTDTDTDGVQRPGDGNRVADENRYRYAAT